jgi:hypothetical protein
MSQPPALAVEHLWLTAVIILQIVCGTTPVLGEADRHGIACCLETSTEANRRFYERRGFIEQTEVLIPAGPPTWWLRRPTPA